MFKNEYQSGMEKISATAAWKQETWKRMQAAQISTDKKRGSIAVSFRKKLALGVAAVLVLLAVPAVYRSGALRSTVPSTPQTAPAAAQDDYAAASTAVSALAGASEPAIASGTDSGIAEAAATPRVTAAMANENAQSAGVLADDKPVESGQLKADSTLRTEDEALAALLAGEGMVAGVDTQTVGGYETENLTVVACVLLTQADVQSDDNALPDALSYPVYRFTVQLSSQKNTTLYVSARIL